MPLFELVVDGGAVSVHRSVEEAQDLADDLLPHNLRLVIRAVPSDPDSPDPSERLGTWSYDRASKRWIEQ